MELPRAVEQKKFFLSFFFLSILFPLTLSYLLEGMGQWFYFLKEEMMSMA